MPAPVATRWAGLLSIVAAALIVLSQVLRLGIGLLLGSDSATTVAHTVTYGVALLGIFHDEDVRNAVADRIVDVTQFAARKAA